MPTTDQLPLWFLFVLGTVFGSIWGSFLHVAYWRAPQMLKNLNTPQTPKPPLTLSFPRSFCPSCNHQLSWHENIPFFGWISHLGSCTHCKTDIPARYVFWEIFFAAMGIVICTVIPLDELLILNITLLIMFAVVDFGYQLIWKAEYTPQSPTELTSASTANNTPTPVSTTPNPTEQQPPAITATPLEPTPSDSSLTPAPISTEPPQPIDLSAISPLAFSILGTLGTSRLQKFTELSHGWDGPSSLPLQQTSIDTLSAFFEYTHLHPPFASLFMTQPGHLALNWVTPSDHMIELEFHSSTISYFIEKTAAEGSIPATPQGFTALIDIITTNSKP